MSNLPSRFDKSWIGQMLAPVTQTISAFTTRDRQHVAPHDGVEADLEAAGRRRRERHRQR